MNIEAFMLCDAATDSNGKLNVLGAFDTLFAKEVPVQHPFCSIALRARFSKFEEGNHKVKIEFIDEDGRPAMPPIDGNLNVKIADPLFSSVVNLIFNLQRIKFDKFGEFSINLGIDDKQVAQLPLHIKPLR